LDIKFEPRSTAIPYSFDDGEQVLLLVAAVNQLYGANAYALVSMTRHIVRAQVFENRRRRVPGLQVD
jgi:hypothetical protein